MSLASLVGQLLLGWLAADLLSGLFHWWEDRLGREDMPLVGRTVVAPNRLHHREPGAFLATSFRQRNGGTWLLVALVSGVWLALAGFSAVWAAATVGGLVVNEVHRWAHSPARAPAFVRVLHEVGIVQSPRGHSRHHAPPRAAAYCVLTDWLNPPLDALGLWAGLERALAAIGLEPNRGTR